MPIKMKLMLSCLVFSLLCAQITLPMDALENKSNLGKQIIIQAGNRQMLVNGQLTVLDSMWGLSPVLENGTIYVPARNMVRELGGSIRYKNDDQKITISLDNKVLTTYVGSKKIFLNGVMKYVEKEPFVYDGVVWIPIRTLTNGFDLVSKWDQPNKRYVIYVGGNSQRWYEDNYTTKISDYYGSYYDQTIGYTVNYDLSWGDPLVIQNEDGTISTLFYQSDLLQISSYSDYMLSSYSDQEGLVLEESYEDYLHRANLMNGEIKEEQPGVVDKLYTIVEKDRGAIVSYIVFFKEDQVGVIEIVAHEDIYGKEKEVLEEWKRIMRTSFKIDGSVG